MATQPAQAQGSAGDKVKIILAVIAVLAGIVGFYFLAGKPTYIRMGALAVGIVIGAILVFLSPAGPAFIEFARDSVREFKKVVWPERKDTLRMTAIVFGFVLIMAIFLWGCDKVLDFLLYNIVLGWKK